MNKHTLAYTVIRRAYLSGLSAGMGRNELTFQAAGSMADAFANANTEPVLDAAPDLLAALIDFVDRGEWDAEEVIDGSPIARAISAIAKARGA